MTVKYYVRIISSAIKLRNYSTKEKDKRKSTRTFFYINMFLLFTKIVENRLITYINIVSII